MGEPKQLLRVSGDTSLVERTANAMLASRLDRACVVVAPRQPEVARSVSALPLELVESTNPSEGIAASIRAAAEWAARGRADGLLLCVCDQPLLTAHHLNRLLEAFTIEPLPVASYYADKPGVPAIFPAAYLPALLRLSGDQGASKLLRSAERISLVTWPDGAEDLDSPADLLRWRLRTQTPKAV
jgi:CTP:molybdopterin cytidylyltransferase MocA